MIVMMCLDDKKKKVLQLHPSMEMYVLLSDMPRTANPGEEIIEFDWKMFEKKLHSRLSYLLINKAYDEVAMLSEAYSRLLPYKDTIRFVKLEY